MADEKRTEKFQMMMSPSEIEAIDDWSFKNRIRSRAEAIRRLAQIGLTAHGLEKPNVAEMNALLDSLMALIEYAKKRADVDTEFLDLVSQISELASKASTLAVFLEYACEPDSDEDAVVSLEGKRNEIMGQSERLAHSRAERVRVTGGKATDPA